MRCSLLLFAGLNLRRPSHICYQNTIVHLNLRSRLQLSSLAEYTPAACRNDSATLWDLKKQELSWHRAATLAEGFVKVPRTSVSHLWKRRWETHVDMFDLDSMKLWSARMFHRAICCAFRLRPSKESFGFFNRLIFSIACDVFRRSMSSWPFPMHHVAFSTSPSNGGWTINRRGFWTSEPIQVS